MADRIPKILIVDDEPTSLIADNKPTNLEYLQAIFDVEGFSVSLAESGEEALALASGDPPDLVLLDLRMPGIGAMEALRRFKALAAELPVIMLTTHGEIAEAVEAIKLGAEDFLIRPVQSDHLVLSVRHALERRGLKAQVANLRRTQDQAQELTRARDAALEMANLKSDFLARMSHEIRTPLNAMVGLTELLLLSDISASAREQLGIVSSSSYLLLKVVNEILDFAKLDAGKVVLDEVNFALTELLKDTVETFAAMAFRKGLALESRIDPEVPPRLRGDPQRLRQVLNNLISNAIKFTPQGHVFVAVTKLEEAKDDVLIGFEIQDTGIGIPPEIRERLFQPFVQADSSTSRGYGGTGLGLVIASRIVEQMHGHISFRSEPGKGSTFNFSCRLEKENSAQAKPGAITALPSNSAEREAKVLSQPKPNEPNWRSRITVLVVEDNKANRFVAPLQLAALGYTADAVEDGFKALEVLSHRNYDIVLMDCEMPGIDGYETTAEIRSREGSRRHTVVIAVTAHAFAAIRDHCLAAGMDDFLAKPVTLKPLGAALDQWARRIVSGEDLCTAGRPVVTPWHELDHAYVDEMCALSSAAGRDVFQDLVDTFLSELPSLVAELKSAIGTRNPETLRKAAHALKGAAASVGARAYAKKCECVQHSDEQSDSDPYRDAEALVMEAKGLPKLLGAAVKMQQANQSALS